MIGWKSLASVSWRIDKLGARQNELKQALGTELDSNIANQIEEILDNIDEEDK